MGMKTSTGSVVPFRRRQSTRRYTNRRASIPRPFRPREYRSGNCLVALSSRAARSRVPSTVNSIRCGCPISPTTTSAVIDANAAPAEPRRMGRPVRVQPRECHAHWRPFGQRARHRSPSPAYACRPRQPDRIADKRLQRSPSPQHHVDHGEEVFVKLATRAFGSASRKSW